MPSIYPAAIITTAVAVALVWGLTQLAGRGNGRLAWVALLTIPMVPVVNWWVKKPLLVVAGQAASKQGIETPSWFILFFFLLSPFTEEAFKALPLAIPQVSRRLDGLGSALWMGMFLGAGFGLGEIWFLAYGYARVPALSGYPFWYFTGFLAERLVVIYAHGVMTAVVMVGALRGRLGLLGGYLAAVTLHALLNGGAMLHRLGLLDMVWTQIWTYAVGAVLFTVLFQRLYSAALDRARNRENVIFHRETDHPRTD